MSEPQDVQAEQVCLGLWFSGHQSSLALARTLAPSWFLHAGRADACAAAMAADAEGIELTPEEVVRRMTWDGDRVSILSEAINGIGIGGAQWVVRLRETWRRREVIRAIATLLRAISDSGEGFRAAIFRWRARIDELTREETAETWADVVERVLHARVDGRPAVDRVPTGLDEFDERIGGG